MFPKIKDPPNHPSYIIGFSIIFTIHFGGGIPYFWFNTHFHHHPNFFPHLPHIYLWICDSLSREVVPQKNYNRWGWPGDLKGLKGLRFGCVFLERKVIFESWFMNRNFTNQLLGGGFKYFLFSSRSLGKIPILTNIFQRGWNHQLVIFESWFMKKTWMDPCWCSFWAFGQCNSPVGFIA